MRGFVRCDGANRQAIEVNALASLDAALLITDVAGVELQRPPILIGSISGSATAMSSRTPILSGLHSPNVFGYLLPEWPGCRRLCVSTLAAVVWFGYLGAVQFLLSPLEPRHHQCRGFYLCAPCLMRLAWSYRPVQASAQSPESPLEIFPPILIAGICPLLAAT